VPPRFKTHRDSYRGDSEEVKGEAAAGAEDFSSWGAETGHSSELCCKDEQSKVLVALASVHECRIGDSANGDCANPTALS
jgi:hypothetical protein